MVDTGQTLGLVLLYVVMAGYALLLLYIFVQILFRTTIEKHRRRQFNQNNDGAAYAPRAFVGKRGWANTGLARNPEINQSVQNGHLTSKLASTAPIIKQAIAVVSMVIVFGLASSVAAQQPTGRETTASMLKQQLFDLESKETQLRLRLEELDAQLKPESIERELAGVGSTHPEELREHRRRLLTIERNGLQTQLDRLEDDRARIEAAIAAVGTAANLEYPEPSPSMPVATGPATPTTEMISLRDVRSTELPLQKLYVAVAMLALLGGVFILILIIAHRRSSSGSAL